MHCRAPAAPSSGLCGGGRHKDSGGVTRGNDSRETQRLSQTQHVEFSSMIQYDTANAFAALAACCSIRMSMVDVRYLGLCSSLHSLERVLFIASPLITALVAAISTSSYQLFCCMSRFTKYPIHISISVIDKTRHWKANVKGASLAYRALRVTRPSILVVSFITNTITT